MANMTRRRFLRNASIGAAAAGTAAVLPHVLGVTASSGPATGDPTVHGRRVSPAEARLINGPLVAHVRDASTGDDSHASLALGAARASCAWSGKRSSQKDRRVPRRRTVSAIR
jgi:hypothetical protein